jgi:hypothetical protein
MTSTINSSEHELLLCIGYAIGRSAETILRLYIVPCVDIYQKHDPFDLCLVHLSGNRRLTIPPKGFKLQVIIRPLASVA